MLLWDLLVLLVVGMVIIGVLARFAAPAARKQRGTRMRVGPKPKQSGTRRRRG